MKIITTLFVLILSSSMAWSSPMEQFEMESIVKSLDKDAKGGGGVVELTYSGVKLILISDEKHDRMRIISQIADYKALTREHIDAIMESNFHTALDARYAVSEGVLYSVYVHPISGLNKNQIESALLQVANLALSFGREYSSGVLSYGG